MSGALTDTSILAGASAAGAYTIDQSCRIDATNKLQKTISGDGNKTTWTMSIWTKNAFNWDITADNTLFSAQHTSGGGSGRFNAYFRGQLPNTYFECSEYTSSGYSTQLHTQAVFRDPGAWLHVIVVWDTTNNTEADRIRYYFNGERITAFGTGGTSPNYPSLNEPSSINNANCAQTIGALDGDTATSITSYLAEVHFIDGQALGPENFGETNADTNQWQAIKYAGTYGTKGYYMKFDDSGDFGNDSSGNGNDYTSTGLAATDQVPDSPTNNWCTMNPLVKPFGTVTWSEGNLKGIAGNVFQGTAATMLAGPSGKWYWEHYIHTVGNTFTGVVLPSDTSWFRGSAEGPQQAGRSLLYNNNGYTYIDGSQSGSIWGATYTTGDIIGIAVDMDTSNGQVTFYKNGTSQGTLSFTSTNMSDATNVVPGTVLNGATATFNFGQDSSFAGAKTAQGNTDANGLGDFYYTVPAGYLAICASNLSDPSIILPGEHFNTVLYTGNGSTQSISGVGFQPDTVWIKDRTTTESHHLYDAIRGATETLLVNQTQAEFTGADRLTAFDSDGFSLGSNDGVNKNTDNIVSWNWKANGTGVANTDGSLDSTVSVNSAAGYSIVSYTGNSASAQTVGHGLSVVPELIAIKNLTDDVFWPGGTTYGGGWTKYLNWNSNEPQQTGTYFNDTAPTASVFSVSTQNAVNGNTNEFIAYCFHSVEGYQKIGRYVGNGNTNGTFIYTGFRPAYFVIKDLDVNQWWCTQDNKRVGYNVDNNTLAQNDSYQEQTDDRLDIVSNGVKLRATFGSSNTNGNDYLYWAIAEFPFKTANAR